MEASAKNDDEWRSRESEGGSRGWGTNPEDAEKTSTTANLALVGRRSKPMDVIDEELRGDAKHQSPIAGDSSETVNMVEDIVPTYHSRIMRALMDENTKDREEARCVGH